MTSINLTELRAEPVGTVIEELELALAKAKSGELRTVAIVGQLKSGNMFMAYDADDVFVMIASLELMKFDLISAPDKVPTNDPRQT